MKVYMDDATRFNIINHYDSLKIIYNLLLAYLYFAIKISNINGFLLWKAIYTYDLKEFELEKNWLNEQNYLMIELVYWSVHVQF